jgi:hypothetical protein
MNNGNRKARICLVAEGSYPYVTGGVSSWINQLMLSLPEFEFELIAISPEAERAGGSKYKYPENLTCIHDIFLDDLVNQKIRHRHFNLCTNDIEELRLLLIGKQNDWHFLF